MVRTWDYYIGDMLTKIGCGILGGAATQIHVMKTIEVMPTFAFIISLCMMFGGTNLMKRNE